MKKLLVAVAVVAVSVAGVSAEELRDRMEFPASQGTVVFYHLNHINEIHGACQPCHAGTPGRIAGFGKEWAHRICLECHAPREGYPEGPTRCEGCHIR